MSERRTFQRLFGSLKNYLLELTRVRIPKTSLLAVNVTYQDSLAKCMMIYDTLNSDNYAVKTEMTATKHILTSHVGSTDES